MKLAMLKPAAAQARAVRAPAARVTCLAVPEMLKRATATVGVSLAALALSGSALAATVKLGADNGERARGAAHLARVMQMPGPARARSSATRRDFRADRPRPPPRAKPAAQIVARAGCIPTRPPPPPLTRSTLPPPLPTGSPVFDPATVTIAKGESITWVNNVGFPHNIVFDEDAVPGGVNAEALGHEEYLNAPGEKHTVKFDTAGEYSYYCEPHQGAGMVGKVIVQ